VLLSILTFSVAAALIVLLPGPDTLVVLRSIVRDGRRRAMWTAAGGLTGLATWVTVAALGLSAVLRASHDAYLALRLVGAAYLVWLGVQSWRTRASKPDDDEAGRRRAGLLGTGYGAGLATDLLNPKVGVFFVTFLPGFVPAGHSVGWTSLLLGAIFIAETVLYYAALILMSRWVMRWMNDPRVRRRIDRMMGVVFVAFGVRLAVES
jgi:threonine/homoserine/homoserine lactone efflux protein